MRKQNSSFQTEFISEAGIDLTNNDYFAYVEYDKYACYVIADGLNEHPDPVSASLASQAAFLKFQERPSMSRNTISACLKAANDALCEAEHKDRLKASIMVVITDYTKMRYGYAGNTRLCLYRKGYIQNRSKDTSLANEIAVKQRQPEDVLAEHEEKNNLYAYAGQGQGFSPVISKKIKLQNGDVIALYTRGIWEKIRRKEMDAVFADATEPKEMLLELEGKLFQEQTGRLENYTCAVIYVNKIFLDPNKRRKIKKIIIVSIVAAVAILILSLVLWFLRLWRKKQIEELELRYADTIEYIQDRNFIRAQEECVKALDVAHNLRDKKRIEEISDYQKLIEAINIADEAYYVQNYEEAQSAYLTALNRSRYADRVADEYIDKRLDTVAAYLEVFEYIEMGDALGAAGDYERAEKKYQEAKKMAASAYFEEGRQEAKKSLDNLYTLRSEADQSSIEAAQNKAANEVGAASLVSEGDSAFAKGDYDSANVYYLMALEKYQEMEDTVHVKLLQPKISSASEKLKENVRKKQQAEAYIEAAKEQEASGDKLEAKKQYLFAKNIYRELKMDDKVEQIDGFLEVLETEITAEKEKKEKEEKESEEAEQAEPVEEQIPQTTEADNSEVLSEENNIQKENVEY